MPCEMALVFDVIVVMGCASFRVIKSKKPNKTVWIAMPPKMFPMANEVSPCKVPLITMATSGKLTTNESRMVPPNAAPNLNSSFKSQHYVITYD